MGRWIHLLATIVLGLSSTFAVADGGAFKRMIEDPKAATMPDQAALIAYGDMIGAAFQIADDILDAEGDAIRLGKAAGKDAGRNKATLVAALGLSRAKILRDDCIARACAALAVFGERANTLVEAAHFIAARDH